MMDHHDIPHCSRLLLLTPDTTSQDSSPPGSILEDLFRNNRNILVLSYDAKKIQSTKLEYEKNLKMQNEYSNLTMHITINLLYTICKLNPEHSV